MPVILCCSGGVDSYIAYHWLIDFYTSTQGVDYTPYVHPVYFHLNTPYSDLEVSTVKQLIPNTIVDHSLNLKDRQEEGQNAYIPFRNLYLAMLAEKYGDNIVIAGIKGDNVSDKTPEIFRWISTMLTNIKGSKIKVWSPFWNMTKTQIVKWYLKKDLPVEKLLATVSCYSGQLSSCNKCPSCFRKWVALTLNGIKLDFDNETMLDEYYSRALHNEFDEERNSDILKAIKGYCSRH